MSTSSSSENSYHHESTECPLSKRDPLVPMLRVGPLPELAQPCCVPVPLLSFFQPFCLLYVHTGPGSLHLIATIRLECAAGLCKGLLRAFQLKVWAVSWDAFVCLFSI